MDEKAFEMAQEREERDRQAGIANRVQYAGVSREYCIECEEPIPARRREAIQGVERCFDCASIREARHV